LIAFQKFTLNNGLRVLVHEDRTTPMACVNILYDVGARDESPDKTGFAHLFEHLMFGGSANIPSYDTPLQEVGGQNNAFTSNDITNYYVTLPAANMETAFWLESDRMLGLAFSDRSLEVQRNVVCEEFKQHYLNKPYGDVWLRLRPLAYRRHPYRWATIGRELRHIEQATMADVRAFFGKHYAPNRAVMAVTGDVRPDRARTLAEKWFAGIPRNENHPRDLPPEPPQTEPRREDVWADVPQDSIYIAFHGPGRLHPDYPAMDLLSDLLSRGPSSRLFRALVKDRPVFSEVNAYVLGSIDPNLLTVEGKPLPNIPLAEAEALLWEQLERLKSEPVPDRELQKVKNQVESTMVFSELSILDKAMNLAFYELLGDAELYNREVEKYLAVRPEDILRLAGQVFRRENSSTLVYHAKEVQDVG